jgi:hypothetical protein
MSRVNACDGETDQYDHNHAHTRLEAHLASPFHGR